MFDNFIICLAPMAGVTDFAFREICANLGADMVTTEMISAKALAMGSKKTFDLLHETNHPAVKSVQLFGHETMSVQKVLNTDVLHDFDIIDFNCGCPAPKIVNNGDGSALMKNIEQARKVISALVANSDKPVSVKFRQGIENTNNFVAFAKMCEECGVCFITFHARTREQMYSGSIDFEAYKKLRQAVKIPIIASGDIYDEKSMQKMYDIGMNGVMIGRAAMGNPQIFTRLKNYAKTNNWNVNDSKTKKFENVKEIVSYHFESLLNFYKSEKKAVPYFRKHLSWYVKNLSDANQLRKEIFSLCTECVVKNFINTTF